MVFWNTRCWPVTAARLIRWKAPFADAGQRLLAATEHLHSDWTWWRTIPVARNAGHVACLASPDRRERLIRAGKGAQPLLDLCHLGAEYAHAIAAGCRHGRSYCGAGRGAGPRFDAAELPGSQHDFDFEFPRPDCAGGPIAPPMPQRPCRVPPRRYPGGHGHRPSVHHRVSIAMQAGLGGNGTVLTRAELDALDDASLA